LIGYTLHSGVKASRRGVFEKLASAGPPQARGLKVTVKFFTTLREITGKREEELEMPEVSTVGEVLDELSRRYGAHFADYVFEKGNVRPYLQILINGRNINLLQGLGTRVEEGDTIAILPPAGGG